MLGVTIENYSSVWGKDEQECKNKVRKLMDEGRITEIVAEPHPSRPSAVRLGKKCDWVAYVR